MTVKIGTCGFRTNKLEYAGQLSCVEVQHTFYQPPRIATLTRWREEMPRDFEFTLKAWQLITHEATSPTYRRLRRKLNDREAEDAGAFKATPIVAEALETTLACADALKAKTVLFQCPSSFKPSDRNIANLENFFKMIPRRRGRIFCWEPRGEWDDQLVRELCRRLALWHVVDPFVKPTMTPDRCYYRLHGIGGWRYRYEDGELEELVSLLPRRRSCYVFFNNSFMTEDAVRFREIIAGS